MNFAMTLADPSRPAVADFHRVNRGGGLFSESVSQWIGAVFALAAQRLGLRPTALSVTNLVLGLAASVTVVALAGPVAAGDVPAWAVGLVALVGWQLAYALDCADGQLARVTGQGNAAGARVDVLCDVAVQIALVAALGATAVAQRPSTPTWLMVVFAGTWMVNLVTSVMQAGPNAASMVTSSSFPVRLVKLVRDYGAVIFLAGLVLTVAPALTIWLVVAFTIVNGGFLLASITFSARASLR
ncbi:CDP-alcohol phosphatidyltransferase family protein [Micromonospora sp. NPDC007230]|uniref:CDP-alcohol phosphatidyltransferase family protein n=1 Tax=Micromonospora sp. NPDC007230 TaxID=3364237 RepID=UPI003684A8FB